MRPCGSSPDGCNFMRYQRRPTGAKKAKFEAKLETVKFEEPGDGEEGSGHKFMLETLNPIEEKVLQT